MILRFLFLLVVTCAALGAEDGKLVVVVYNSNMPVSKSVAEYYAERRAVPKEQVVGLPLSEKETISRADYRTQLAEPLLKHLEQNKLMTFKTRAWTNSAGKQMEASLVDHATIRYAALCFGVPVKIEQDNSVDEPNPDKQGPAVLRNEAAVDSELTLLPMYHAKPALNGPVGNQHYASTNLSWMHPTNGILMVARLDGPTPEIARGLVDKAVQAEKEGLWGRAYFDTRGLKEGEYKVGDDMLRAAQKSAERHGFEIIHDEQPGVFPPAFPMPQIGIYAGWYEHNVTGAMAQPALEFMPGAFAYHLHSWSAELVRSPSERWVGPLLAKGATCTMGSVYEPFLQGTTDIAVFLGRWLFDGASFAEAAYNAQRVLSWQTTVIGDPLYRPFHKKPQQQHEELEKSRSKLFEWSVLRVANINLATALPPDQIITFLKEQPLLKTSALLNEKLGDLLKAKGKVIDAAGAYEAALKADPTPQQRLRIALLLGVMQTNLGRNKQAYELYSGLLKDYPDYPDKLKLYQRILPLADKFGKPGDTAEYQRLIKELTPKT